MYQVAYGHNNMGGRDRGRGRSEFKKKFNDDFYTARLPSACIEMLSQAMAKAKSTDPVKVAKAMEGLKVKSFNGEVEMRKSDHQLQQPLYITMWQKADAKNAVQRGEHRHHLRAGQGVPEPTCRARPPAAR